MIIPFDAVALGWYQYKWLKFQSLIIYINHAIKLIKLTKIYTLPNSKDSQIPAIFKNLTAFSLAIDRVTGFFKFANETAEFSKV